MFAVWLRLWSWVCGNFLAHFMLRPILQLLTLLARLHNHIKTFFGNLSYHNVGREGHQSYTSLHTNYISAVADMTGLFKFACMYVIIVGLVEWTPYLGRKVGIL